MSCAVADFCSEEVTEMLHDAMCEIIDRLIYDSGMTEAEAISLVGRMLEESADLLETMQMMRKEEKTRLLH